MNVDFVKKLKAAVLHLKAAGYDLECMHMVTRDAFGSSIRLALTSSLGYLTDLITGPSKLEGLNGLTYIFADEVEKLFTLSQLIDISESLPSLVEGSLEVNSPEDLELLHNFQLLNVYRPEYSSDGNEFETRLDEIFTNAFNDHLEIVIEVFKRDGHLIPLVYAPKTKEDDYLFWPQRPASLASISSPSGFMMLKVKPNVFDDFTYDLTVPLGFERRLRTAYVKHFVVNDIASSVWIIPVEAFGSETEANYIDGLLVPVPEGVSDLGLYAKTIAMLFDQFETQGTIEKDCFPLALRAAAAL